jgi:xanthine/CO dehydrogenase XdhC/CoxF family maturation factor
MVTFRAAAAGGCVEAALASKAAVVFLFYDHHSEAGLLAATLNSEAFYIGALGSRRAHVASFVRSSWGSMTPGRDRRSDQDAA